MKIAETIMSFSHKILQLTQVSPNARLKDHLTIHKNSGRD